MLLGYLLVHCGGDWIDQVLVNADAECGRETLEKSANTCQRRESGE